MVFQFFFSHIETVNQSHNIMSDNVEAVCNAGGDSGAHTITETPSSLPVQNTGDIAIAPVADPTPKTGNETKVTPPITEVQQPKKVRMILY